MTIGISKEVLIEKFSTYYWQSNNCNELLDKLIAECTELNQWLPVDEARTSGKRYLLLNKLWDAPSTGCFDGTNWAIQPGIKPFFHQPTHYQELPGDPL